MTSTPDNPAAQDAGVIGRFGGEHEWLSNFHEGEPWANKIARGFNTTDIPRDFAFLHAEVSEAFEAWRRAGNVGPELADVVIFAAGLAQMTGCDLAAEVAGKLAVNAARTYTRLANGTHQKAATAPAPGGGQ